MSAKKQTVEKLPEMVNVENVENINPKVIEVFNPPKMSPELVNNIIDGNFDHIKKHFGKTAWSKAKNKEQKVALLQKYKKLVDSMEYLYADWGGE